MRRIAGLSGLLALFLCLAAVAGAQEQSSSIQGVVRDLQGAVLPGATVEARNPLGGVNTVVTNAEGVFRFPALPPGTYELTATLQGFRPAKLPNTVLELGKNLTLEMAMEVASLTETVSVTAESSPIIDVKGNTVSATFSKATIDRMPKGRDFTTILRQAPGAQQNPRRELRRGCASRSMGRLAPRTASSSTAWTRRTCRPASRARRCCSTSRMKCRSSHPATTPSSAAPPAASSTC